MKELFLIKLGEMVLKGQNRAAFDSTLLKTIRRRLYSAGEFEVRYAQSTIYVIPKNENCDMDRAQDKLSKIFGIVAFTRAGAAEKELSSICETAVEYLADQLAAAGSFKVESKRADKSFPLTSLELSREVGAAILRKYHHLKVDVHNPELTVRAEVRDFGAYLHTDPLPGAGGMPSGTGGKAAILISGGIDSPIAAWMMARRGVELVPVHFASPPYTSERAEQKVVELLEKVAAYCGPMKMRTVSITHIQEEILQKCPEELFTVIMRRFMVRISNRIAQSEDCGALITGESLGQVASQTMQAIRCTDAVAELPVFRPLIGTDKAEIVAVAHRIGTYEISIEPYEDCCTVFTPRHPRTKPPVFVIEKAETALDVDTLVAEALESVKITPIRIR
ncbi:MAG: tRNA 4-thiouridine(8) synthase ThiI [Clostridia bacterium]|nr:tRNA 4-thiouridine(8) synthase ThiI [Clostridia bacterium]